MGKYWEFKNKSDIESDLYLYSEIDSWGDGEYAHSAKSFKNELDTLGDIGTLNIYINSPGGDVFKGVVNEKDLYDALCNNVIAGAATDVLTTEPPINNVLIDNKYPDNLIVTPHVAWGTLNARLEIIRQMSEHIKNFKTKN